MQSVSAFRTTYDKEAFNTMMSETEIKQFLPGTREPETLALIQKLLGDESIVVKNHSGNKNTPGINGYNYHEEAKPLLRSEEIRRTDKTILFIRRNRPILTETPPVAAIHPWRRQIGINPYFGKPYLKPVKLRLGRRKGGRS